MAIGLIAYFGFFAILGERGYFVLQDINLEKVVAEHEVSVLVSRREELENRVARLQATSLDEDMLDERIRAMLGYTRPDEIVVMLSP